MEKVFQTDRDCRQRRKRAYRAETSLKNTVNMEWGWGGQLEFKYSQIGRFSFTPPATLGSSQAPKAELYSRTAVKEWSGPVAASFCQRPCLL